jgi:hypothetical protein
VPSHSATPAGRVSRNAATQFRPDHRKLHLARPHQQLPEEDPAEVRYLDYVTEAPAGNFLFDPIDQGA